MLYKKVGVCLHVPKYLVQEKTKLFLFVFRCYFGFIKGTFIRCLFRNGEDFTRYSSSSIDNLSIREHSNDSYRHEQSENCQPTNRPNQR